MCWELLADLCKGVIQELKGELSNGINDLGEHDGGGMHFLTAPEVLVSFVSALSLLHEPLVFETSGQWR